MQIVHSLPLDLIGDNPANRISDEIHTLQPKAVRCLAPAYGGFYTESVVVFDDTTNVELVKDIDYKCWNVLCVPSGKSGKEICSIIVILNSAVNDTVRINYSAVGSFYCKTYETIKNLMDALTLDSRPFSWPNLLHRPNSFNPTQHFVNLGEIIGFDYVATVLESIRNTILLGDDVSHDAILTYTDTSISAYITALNARITSEIVPAAANAAAALTAANTALSQATAIVTANTVAATNASNALVIATAVQTDEQSTATRAQALITDALGTRSFVRVRPPVDPLVAVTIGTSGPHPLIDYDYFSIDTLGSVQLRGIPEVPANPDIFTVLFQTLRDNTDGTISFNLYITLNDFRTNFFYEEITDSTQLFVANKVVNDGAVDRHVYVSGGNGYYVPTSDIIIYPPRLSNDKHNTLAVADLNSGLAPVSISDASITHWFNGIDNKTYSIPGVVETDKNPKYGIIGVDDQTNLIDAVDITGNAVGNRIASSLFDFTTDYNTSGYGSVYKRRPIRLRLTPGSVFQISAKLKSVDLSTLVKSIIVPFRKEISIRYTSDWDVHASGGNITGVTDVHTVTSTNPDAGRIRSVSADIDTSIATGSVANTVETTPPAGPTTFIAPQFDAFIYVRNVGGVDEKLLTITNRSEGNVLIDLISYYNGTTTEIVRHTSRLPAFGFEYSHSLYSFITFPITPLGGGLDVTEYIKWYLSNGQLVTFAVNAGTNVVTVTTSAEASPIVYTPVFSGLALIPSSGVTGSSSTLRATFSGLSPQVVTTVYIDSITDGVGQYHGIFANTSGVGTYDWTVTVGTGDRDYSVTSLGVTFTQTLALSVTPTFSSFSVTPTNGVEGASASLVAQFSNLTPSAVTVITISGAAGISNGNINVTADSSGNGTFIWAVAVGSADFTFSATALTAVRSCTLTKNYQPIFTGAVFLSPHAISAYDQQALILRVSFSAMRPSSSLGIPVTLTPTGITGTSGTQTPTVVSDGSGNGYVDFSYTMGTVSGRVVSSTSLYATHSAFIVNQGPVLYNYFPSADGVLIGTTVTFTAVFNSVPLSGPSIAASILVDGVSTAITIVPNGTGLYSLVVSTYTFYAWSTVHTTSVHYKTITLNTGSSSINDPALSAGG